MPAVKRNCAQRFSHSPFDLADIAIRSSSAMDFLLLWLADISHAFANLRPSAKLRANVRFSLAARP